jgi:hypothetical protein
VLLSLSIACQGWQCCVCSNAENLHCCHLQLYEIAAKFGVELMVVCGGVVKTSAEREADEAASKEGFYVSGLDVASGKPNRRLIIVKKGAGVHWQRAMQDGNPCMKTATQMLAQVLHMGIKAEVQASQPGVSCSMHWLS